MNIIPPISPKDVLSQVSLALPKACRQDVIIIGSLAAGYYYFADDGDKAIRTKDIDCMFSPHAKAVAAAAQVTEELLAAKWEQRQDTNWSKPGSPADPTDKLPMVRLKPPGGSDWFVELLGAPDAWDPKAPMKQFHRVTTSRGDFAICSFGFLGLAEHGTGRSAFPSWRWKAADHAGVRPNSFAPGYAPAAIAARGFRQALPQPFARRVPAKRPASAPSTPKISQPSSNPSFRSIVCGPSAPQLSATFPLGNSPIDFRPSAMSNYPSVTLEH